MTESSSTLDLDRETNDDSVTSNKIINELVFDLEKRVCFEYVENKLKLVRPYWPSDLGGSDVYSICGDGYIEIKNDTSIDYINFNSEVARDNGFWIVKLLMIPFENNIIGNIIAENIFNKPNESFGLNCTTFTLFYYKIKCQFKEIAWVGLGLEHGNDFFALLPMDKFIYYRFQNVVKTIKISPFYLNSGDIFGCGLVYPPLNMSNKLAPYIFFTQNGKQIGKAILLKQNYKYMGPNIGLNSCSIEANFGKDLISKPFMYRISNHYIAEEFYKDEEFSDN
ncbi:hypothetical protein Mgra_00006950 [Meloidogyne graminicola]|uniref:SPRY domain-containing protein n=1 Tax=Meloidogyne graminicola TaxID=189291 RepID=A0A8S9ZJV1_9BILA|nr:hypothetical protein Mgra_00006950 [Meloidogyne graminicola]